MEQERRWKEKKPPYIDDLLQNILATFWLVRSLLLKMQIISHCSILDGFT